MFGTKYTRFSHFIIIIFLFLYLTIILLGCGSDSSPKKIYVTDYFSYYGGSLGDDNNDDRPAIEAAMANAKVGEVVYFPNGTYNLKSFWSGMTNCNIKLTTGKDLCGESETGVILKTTLNDNGSAPEASNYLIQGMEARNIAISNLTLTSTWNGPYPDSIDNNNPNAGGPTYGIGIENLLTTKTDKASSNITIDHVTIGIMIGGSGSTHDKSGPNNWVHHNLFNSSKGGISCEFGSNYEKIEDNEIKNDNHPEGFGIRIGKSDGTIVNSNYIHNNTATLFNSIYLFLNNAANDEPAGSLRNCAIKNNRMVDNTTNNVAWDPAIDLNTNDISNN